MTNQPPEPVSQHPDAQPPNPPLPEAFVRPAPVDPMDVLDLDNERSRRAAAREGKKKDLPVRIGGEVIAVLPVEMPIDWLAPVRTLDDDVAIVLRESMQAVKVKGDRSEESFAAVVDMLAASPRLPVNTLDAIAQVGRNVLGDSGFEKFMAARPSVPDIIAFGKGVLGFYGVTLGEALQPSDSSTNAGETSNTTSGPTSVSTPAISGPTPEPSTPTGEVVTSGSAAS